MTRDFTYTKEDLLYALMATRQWQSHEVMREDAQKFLTALEQGFGLSLSADGVLPERRAIWMVFRACVENFAALQTPLGGALESSLFITQLKAQGASGEEVMRQITETSQAIVKAREAYFPLITALFDVLWQPQVEVIHSDRLLEFGFNDAERPDPMDFW